MTRSSHLPIPELRYVLDEKGELLTEEVVRNKGHKSEHTTKFLITTVTFPIVRYPSDKLFEKYVQPVAEEIANSLFRIPLAYGDPKSAIDFIFASASMWWYHPLFRFDTLVRDMLCGIPQEMIRKGFYLLSDYLVREDEDEGGFSKEKIYDYTWETKAAYLFWLGRTGDGVVAKAAGFKGKNDWCEGWKKRASKKDKEWYEEKILPIIEDWELFHKRAINFLDKSLPKSKANKREKEKSNKKNIARRKHEHLKVDLHEFCGYQTVDEW
jgi:hypothetical protein